MSATHKALFVDASGTFTVSDTPRPHPAENELLIKVHAAGLNPADWKVHRLGILPPERYPITMGLDIAGDVEEVGEGVVGFEKGDRVFCQADITQKGRGAFQQYVICLADVTSKIPPALSYDEVATLPIALSTTFSGLYSGEPSGLGLDSPFSDTTDREYAGTPFVILGGSSSLGQFALQLARLSGFSPIIPTASMKHADALRALGATHVLDRNLSSSSLKAEIPNIIPSGKAPELVYDSISDANTQKTALEILGQNGILCTVGTLQVQGPDESSGKKVVHAFGELRAPHNREMFRILYGQRIYGLLEKGEIVPNRVEVLPNGLSGIPDGLKRLEAGQVSRLKLIAHPHEAL